MPIRWDAQEAITTLLSAEITPANGYTFDLSVSGAITNGTQTMSQRQSEMLGEVQMQVNEGREDHTMLEISPDTKREATFEIVLSCLLLGGRTADSIRKRANLFLGDLNKGIHKHTTLGGIVRRIHVARVDEPEYDASEDRAHLVVRVACVYFYTAGTDV